MKRLNLDNSDLPIFSVTKDKGLILQSEKYGKRIASANTSKYKIVEYGEFAYDPMSLYYGAIGRQNKLPMGIVSPAYVCFAYKESILPDYLEYVLKDARVRHEFNQSSYGGNSDGKRKKIEWRAFGDVYIPLPPLPVQRWIADALASVDEWLDKNVENSKLLDAARRKVLASIFPPGTIELSEIIDSVDSGVSAEGANKPAGKDESGVLKVSAVAQGFFKPRENKTVVGEEISRLRTSVNAGDILVSRSNTLELVGEVGMPLQDSPNLFLPDKLWALRISPSKKIDPKWLMYYLINVKNSGAIANLASGSSGSMKNISQKSYLKILIPKQKIEQQKAISVALTAFDKNIVLQNELLAEVRTFRQSLLHQLLSGSLQPQGGWASVIPAAAP
ncbi:restriction endonuclease subunit S [Deinococcus frigens]|uniref:restriction endonuclease subunit S n=1 Tax=Deinococcus frigens TaxID=249403 RepID=UPI000A5F7689|nr:restriction endonuclease subunit S [Deinococcus frigens]